MGKKAQKGQPESERRAICINENPSNRTNSKKNHHLQIGHKRSQPFNERPPVFVSSLSKMRLKINLSKEKNFSKLKIFPTQNQNINKMKTYNY